MVVTLGGESADMAKKPLLFISHSQKDHMVADALVRFLVTAGVSRDNILCTSTPETRLSTGKLLYESLRDALNSSNVYMIYLLSDHYYSSPVCLNEMGAAWVRGIEGFPFILPGFSFDRVEGVIKGQERIGISLATCDDMTKARLYDFKSQIESFYHISIPSDVWDLGRNAFFDSVKAYEQMLSVNAPPYLDMKIADGYCIGDLLKDGCQVIRKMSSSEVTTAKIDFGKTTSPLCSVVYPTLTQDWTLPFQNKQHLCFDISSDLDTAFSVVVELKLPNRSSQHSILVVNDRTTYRIPLCQFSSNKIERNPVTEVCFLIYKKPELSPFTLTIENLRLE